MIKRPQSLSIKAKKKVKELKETAQFFSILLILIGLACVLTVSVYNPIRLYQTGKNVEFNVILKKEAWNYSRNGPFVSGKYAMVAGVKNRNYISSDKLYDQIKIGDKVTVFYSEYLDAGIITSQKQPSMLHCIVNYKGYFSIFFTIAGTLMIIYILYRAFRSNFNSINKRIQEEKIRLPEKAKKYSLIKALFIAKSFTPDFIIISFGYLLAFLAVRAVLMFESSDELTLGFILFFSIITISFVPYLSLSLKKFFGKFFYLMTLLNLIKLCTGCYGLYMTMSFINVSTFEQGDFYNLIAKYFKYLIGL